MLYLWLKIIEKMSRNVKSKRKNILVILIQNWLETNVDDFLSLE